MPRDNTLHVYLKDIYFDRVTVAHMWVYVVTFIQANVDGDVQMYVSPSSFPITRRRRRGDDLAHRWDGAGALIASLPTEDLESVRMTTFLVRDRQKARQAGEFLSDSFQDGSEGRALATAIGTALGAVPGGAGVVATTLLSLAPAVANFIGKALIRVKDTIRIYGDGTVLFDEPGDFSDAVREWSINRSDKGYFRTVWDFRNTENPGAELRTLALSSDLRSYFKLDQ